MRGENWNAESTPKLLEQIGESIKGKRLQKNISQDELSHLSGVSLASITRLETGRGNTSLVNLLAILKALGAADELQSVFGPPESSPILLARAVSGKTLERVKRTQSLKKKEKDEWKWGEDK
jgi:transcriptional regulator with XRE-family HTH domain